MIPIRYLSNYKVVQLSLHHLFILPIDKLKKVWYNNKNTWWAGIKTDMSKVRTVGSAAANGAHPWRSIRPGAGHKLDARKTAANRMKEDGN